MAQKSFTQQVEEGMLTILDSAEHKKMFKSAAKESCCKCESKCGDCPCKLKEGCKKDCNSCAEVKKKAWINSETASKDLSKIINGLLSLSQHQEEQGLVSESVKTLKVAEGLMADENEVSFLGQLVDNEEITTDDLEDYSENGEDDPNVQNFWMEFQQQHPDLAGELISRTKTQLNPTESDVFEIAQNDNYSEDLDKALELEVDDYTPLPEAPPSSGSPTMPFIPPNAKLPLTEEQYAVMLEPKHKAYEEWFERTKDERAKHEEGLRNVMKAQQDLRDQLEEGQKETKIPDGSPTNLPEDNDVRNRPTVASVANKFLNKYAAEFDDLGLPEGEVEEMDLDMEKDENPFGLDIDFSSNKNESVKALEEMAEMEDEEDDEDAEYEALFQRDSDSPDALFDTVEDDEEDDDDDSEDFEDEEDFLAELESEDFSFANDRF